VSVSAEDARKILVQRHKGDYARTLALDEANVCATLAVAEAIDALTSVIRELIESAETPA
jgi:hypothetical protein